MLQRNALQIDCVIVGDVPGSGLISRSQLQFLPAVREIYTHDVETAAAVKTSRDSLNLSDVQLHDTAELFPSVISPEGGEEIRYFDATGLDIPRYNKVAIGGTFDQLHNGHRKLLTLAAASCHGILVIGITADELTKKKANATRISSFSDRKAGVESFLSLVKPSLKLEPVELNDPYGPTITDSAIDAIVVSSETLNGGRKINSIRKEKGFAPLAILVSRRSDGATLSSSFIRQHEGGSSGDNTGTKRFSFRGMLRRIFRRDQA
jgi:pantetheine-phosphate adenylyltransferase